MKIFLRGFAVAAFMTAFAAPAPYLFAAPQAATASTNDIDQLEDSLLSASDEIEALRATNPTLAGQLSDELADIRDEATYLRVKSRKEPVARSEYLSVRDRIDTLRARATGQSGRSSRPLPPVTDSGSSDESQAPLRSAPGEIPVGQEIDVRLQVPLSSDTAQVEDRFEATTLVDLYQDERLLVPAGSVVRGVVSGVDRAGRADRKGSLTLAFDQITVRGRTYPIRATVTETIESKGIKGEVGKITAGAGLGAVIGGLLGGGKGALIGVLVGSGGTLIATPGHDVEVPAGTVLRARFDSPAEIR